MSEIIETLKTNKTFQYLTNQEIKNFVKKSKIIRYPDNHQIIAQGEIQSTIFIILEGFVKVQIEKDGILSQVATLGEGELVGETALFSDIPRTAFVISDKNVLTLQIERKDFLDYLKTNPYAGNKILMVFIQFLISRLKEVNQEILFDKQISLDQEEINALIDYYIN